MKQFKLLLLALFVLSSVVWADENKVSLQYGVDKNGHLTKFWAEYDSQFDTPQQESTLKKEKKLTTEEIEWADLIASRLSVWESQLDQISVPYTKIDVPRNVSVVVGNSGARDAYTYTEKFPSTIFFNVSVFVRSYGRANDNTNQDRIDRIFAHEFTHLLQHRWSEVNPYPLANPFERALTVSYKEGFGHYRSISNKWKDENGRITQHAQKTLRGLEVAFVDRMLGLKQASGEEAEVLMQGLAMGPFHKKWGALTVALWLVKESNGDDQALIKWVESGPEGILTLANIHLPEELKIKLNKGL